MSRNKVIIILFVIISSCNKAEVVLTSPDLYLNTCVSRRINIESINICFSGLNDSRCPIDATCVWSGEARATFTFIHNNKFHTITLSTLTYASDTLVDGYKFHLVNILPYPSISFPSPLSQIHAELEISR
jgi:hypothetical protein